jgi:hypothetical protein
MDARRRRWTALIGAWLVAASLAGAGAAHAMPVDLELVLAVDCSGSIDDDEFALQIKGYAAAFGHPSVIRAIQSGQHGAIAVTYVQWSGPFLHNQAVGWTLVRDADSAEGFGALMAGARRSIYRGGTSLSGIIDYAATLFARSGYEGTRRVIDISGDGINNTGRRPSDARDDAVGRGLTINGLAILTDFGGLDRYYEEHVIGGPGAFVMAAESFETFAAAILNKLIREIAELSPRQ